MQDKDFLGYFTQLGSSSISELKQASLNIVNTLLASTTTVGKKAKEIDEANPKHA